ncbi:MAG TPA: sensor histidine kinase [Bdellovibrionota bacterium]|nr:sensor histidine kinase [Bdellovibrionota bacterium]
MSEPASRSPGPVSERLRRNKEPILELWEERVRREIFAARHESHPILIDTLPLLLDQLSEALDSDHPRSIAPDGATACQEHGGERARVTGYNVENVIQEYVILREVILEVISQEGQVSERDRAGIRHSIDEIMKQAAIAYGLVQNTIREQFFATLTHDLRGPLTAALSNAQLILKYQDRPEQHARLASKIVQNISRVDKMVTDLLDASRVRAGERLSLHLAELDLAYVARDVAEELMIVHGVQIRLEGGSAAGFWDGHALHRAFENLCANAIKYGDTTKPITVRFEQAHGRTLVTVHNEGDPIPAEDQETLFKAYRRAHASERSATRGWGLGLALVRGVAEAHGGSVMVDSAPGRGTSFIVDMPTDARPFLKKARQPFA